MRMRYKWAMALAGTAGILAVLIERHHKLQLQALKAENDKLSDHYQLLNHWLEVQHEGRSTAEYFQQMGYSRIAVYGMGDLANRLSEELASSGIQIDYGVDRDVSCTIARIENVYSLQEELPPAEVMVVTPYYAFESICNDLKEKIDCPVISLEEVIWSV